MTDICWYSGIPIYKTVVNNTKDTDWNISSKEHLVNKSSPIFNCISLEGEGKYRNCVVVKASKYINGNINTFILPMKYRLRELYSNHYPHFKHNKNVRREEFEAAFRHLYKKIQKEFDLQKLKVKDTRGLYAHPDYLLWELNMLERKLPGVKLCKKSVKVLSVASEVPFSQDRIMYR